MALESRDILQINATIIAGILILLTISSFSVGNSSSHLPVAQNPKSYAGIAIGSFALSSISEIIFIMLNKEFIQKRSADPWSKYNFSLWAMILGFMVLVLLAVILYVNAALVPMPQSS